MVLQIHCVWVHSVFSVGIILCKQKNLTSISHISAGYITTGLWSIPPAPWLKVPTRPSISDGWVITAFIHPGCEEGYVCCQDFRCSAVSLYLTLTRWYCTWTPPPPHLSTNLESITFLVKWWSRETGIADQKVFQCKIPNQVENRPLVNFLTSCSLLHIFFSCIYLFVE